MTTATVRKMGNSLGVVIPRDEAKRLGIHEGDRIEFSLRPAPEVKSIVGMFRGEFADIDQVLRDVDEGADD